MIRIEPKILKTDEDFAMLRKGIELNRASKARSISAEEALSGSAEISAYFEIRAEQEWSHLSLWERLRWRWLSAVGNFSISILVKLNCINNKLKEENDKQRKEIAEKLQEWSAEELEELKVKMTAKERVELERIMQDRGSSSHE